jgi:outer membrane protein assembly factor BamB
MKLWKCACLGFLLAAGTVRSADWPNWRGPNHNGVSTETGWIDHWPYNRPAVLWRAKVGTGFSSFAVAGGRVFTLGNTSNNDTIYCLDAESGAQIWSRSYESELGDNLFEGGATATPTVDGERVYTLGRWGDVLCLEAATGKIVWSKNLKTDAQVRSPGWGFSGSPLVHDNLVIINAGEQGVALDKTTGNIRWKSGDKESGYSTPVPVQVNGKWLAIIGGAKAYCAVDMSDGRAVWRARWMTEFGINSADPVVDSDRVFISSGYDKGAELLKMGAGEPEVVWKSKVMRNHFNSCVLVGSYIYGIDGNADQEPALKCVELATGTQKWKEPKTGAGSLIAADGKLIVLSDIGELIVAPASPAGFKPAGRAQVLNGKCWTSPVLANSRIYCRNAAGDVVCLDARAR